MTRWHVKTKPVTVCASVYVLECFYPPYRDSFGQRTPGRWVTCYAHVYAEGKEKSASMTISAEARRHLKVLMVGNRGWQSKIGSLNLHHEGLCYEALVDAEKAVRYIRKHKTCKYRVRIVRETVWKERIKVIPYDLRPLPKPFEGVK